MLNNVPNPSSLDALLAPSPAGPSLRGLPQSICLIDILKREEGGGNAACGLGDWKARPGPADCERVQVALPAATMRRSNPRNTCPFPTTRLAHPSLPLSRLKCCRRPSSLLTPQVGIQLHQRVNFPQCGPVTVKAKHVSGFGGCESQKGDSQAAGACDMPPISRPLPGGSPGLLGVSQQVGRGSCKASALREHQGL